MNVCSALSFAMYCSGLANWPTGLHGAIKEAILVTQPDKAQRMQFLIKTAEVQRSHACFYSC